MTPAPQYHHPLPKCPSCGKQNISLVVEMVARIENKSIASSYSPVACSRYSLLLQCNDCKTVFVSSEENHFQPFEIIPPEPITPKRWRKILFENWNNVWKNEPGMSGRGSLDDE
jgi:endogenous inhibitor of DNA gyrase (YacG/DUF329 family)